MICHICGKPQGGIMETFYKLAKPDGWDFYTGNTINYRESIGKEVRPKKSGRFELYSATALHASRNPNQCFVGASIPCSVYLVGGTPIVEDRNKCGFKTLTVLEELKPEDVFEWKYSEAINPVDPTKISCNKITERHIALLREWVSVGDYVWDSIKVSIRDSIRDSVMNSVMDSIGDFVWNSIWDFIRISVWNSVRYSIRVSVWDTVWAYVGYIFSPCIQKWKYINHKDGEYPFQSAVDLWKDGLIPGRAKYQWGLVLAKERQFQKIELNEEVK